MPDVPTAGDSGDHQRFSLFHDADDQAMKDWHRPYADAFKSGGAAVVADVGCGTGTFLDLLRERGIQGYGIDFDPDMIAAITRRGHAGAVGDHRALGTMPEAFDGVHLSHIIEHLWGDEAVELLEGARTALRPGGLLIVRTPNWADEHVRNGGFWLDHTHKRPYPGELIKKLLADLGFIVMQTSFEPYGWHDTLVTARRAGTSPAKAAPEPLAAVNVATPPPAPPEPAPAAEITSARPPSAGAAVPQARLWWRGDFLQNHSFARCNRLLAGAIVRGGGFEIVPQGEPLEDCERSIGVPVRLAEEIPDDLPAVLFKHQWPPVFRHPKNGHSIHIQPYEFGALPKAWVRELTAIVDDVWCPTTYVQRLFTDAGVPAERTFVLPWGVDPDIYHPDVAPWDFMVPGMFVILFVGGTVGRKGIDLLVETYLKTFTRSDNVALVIKGFGSNTFYSNQNYTQRIVELSARTDIAVIGYNEMNLTDAQMASLYRGADVLAQPYRGEGFGMPVLEAMACGTPVIVSAGGATDDFVNDDCGYRIPATRQDIGPKIGDDELVGNGWLLEPDPAALARCLRHAYENRAEVRGRGERAAEFVRKNYTWAHAAQKARHRLGELLQRSPLPRRSEDVDNVHAYAINYSSANGEDGFLIEIFARLRVTDPAFVEFGGTTTNVGVLARAFRWSGTVYRPNAAAAAELETAFANVPGMRVLHASYSPANARELAASAVPGAIDLLSITAPRGGAALLSALAERRPRVVVVTTGSGDDSLAAISALGPQLGYALVGAGAAGAAAYFVRVDLLRVSEFPELRPVVAAS